VTTKASQTTMVFVSAPPASCRPGPRVASTKGTRHALRLRPRLRLRRCSCTSSGYESRQDSEKVINELKEELSALAAENRELREERRQSALDAKQYWDDAMFEEWKKGPRALLAIAYNRVVAGKGKLGSAKSILLSSTGIFFGFLALSTAGQYLVSSSVFAKMHQATGAPFIMGSFGTLSILVFGQAASQNIRFWNVVVGHLIGASCGLMSVKMLGYSSLAKAVAMTTTLAGMLWAGAVHPPGGAIALLICEDRRLQVFGTTYILYPALFGAALLYVAGFLTNRLKHHFQAK